MPSSVPQIYASHVFEHVPQALVPPTLAGMHRILKHGGTLMLSVPDMDVRIARHLMTCLLPE
jgi:predicted SAM-dependent methyltransferase